MCVIITVHDNKYNIEQTTGRSLKGISGIRFDEKIFEKLK